MSNMTYKKLDRFIGFRREMGGGGGGGVRCIDIH